MVFGLGVASLPGVVRAAEPARLDWWLQARFGMFIHWDMSSVAGTEISWSRKAKKPLDNGHDPAGYVEDPAYDNLYKRFDPQKFNAREWVKTARDAGMKYMVFTAKHHGGFCMWNTALTDYSIMHTPFKRDVVKELAEACHEAGMPLGIYYSQRDWHQPDYGIGDNRKYCDYLDGQITELLTNYGKIDMLWWDSYGRGDLEKFWRIGRTFDLVKKLQPMILINNRMTVLAGYNRQPAPYRGDFDTPEQRLGKFQNTRPWESCMCLVQAGGGGWSYRTGGKVKSFENCINTLVGCVTGDGNLLLDVGPDPTGVIPADQTARILEMGAWLRKYGVSVYGTRGGPYLNGKWGGSTFRGNTVYLHLKPWQEEKLELPAPKGKVLKCANLTDAGAAVPFVQSATGLALTVPAAKRDPVDTILVLELNGPAQNEFHGTSPIPVAK